MDIKALQEQAKKQAEAAAAANGAPPAVDPQVNIGDKKVDKPAAQMREEIAQAAARSAAAAQVASSGGKGKTYYANLDGCQFHFKDGTSARFENATYHTDDPQQIAELDAVIKLPGNHMFSHDPIPVHRSDAKVLQEVARGVANTQNLAGLSRSR